MSELNNEKEVAEKRKKIPQIEEAPLRDQIPMKLRQRLIDKDVGESISRMWTIGNSDRQEWLERRTGELSEWDEFVLPSAEGAFELSSDLHVPVTFTVAKVMHARLLQALVGIDPPFDVKARTKNLESQEASVKNVMRYAIYKWGNRYKGEESVLDKWVWDFVTAGSAVHKRSWDIKYTSYLDVQEVPVQDMPEEVVDEQTGEIFTRPSFRIEEQEVPVTIKQIDGPKSEFVNMEDFLIIGGCGDVQDADACIHRQFVTASELHQLADQGIFDSSAVKNVIEGAEDLKAGSIPSSRKQDQAENAGQSKLDVVTDLDRYEILEAYVTMDDNDDGLDSEIVVWVHKRTREILRATYLYRINQAGERPFFKGDFHLREGQTYGIGIVEILHPITQEIDAIHNMRIEAGLLSTLPFGFYRPTSNIEPKTITFEPGMLIPVDDPQRDVFFPNLGNRTSFGFQEEEALMTMVERLTSISDLTLGAVTGAQGATRTATGTRALVAESNANLSVHLRRLNRAWTASINYLFHMLQQRMPPELAFRLDGEEGAAEFIEIDKEDIVGDFDLQVSSNSETSNPSVRVEKASMVFQTVNNPLFLQTGVVTPGNQYEALKNLLQSMEIREFSRFITKPSEVTHVLLPHEEADRILRGIDMQVIPQMDHAGFIKYVDNIIANGELLGMYSPGALEALEAQKQAHVQMQDSLKQQQAQQANVQQMQVNAQAGGQQQTAPGSPVQGVS